jgi:C4-dicarboxylate-specific signal transduction histidine kinase
MATHNFQELQVLSKTVLEQQEVIRSQEKLSVIGNLASGVSHEINNPLAIISGTVHILRFLVQKNAPPENIIAELARIDTTVIRLTKIGKALRSISGERAAGFKDAKSIEETFLSMMADAKKSA